MKQDLQMDVYMQTTYLLLRLGFQARQMGYRYLRESIIMGYYDPAAVSSVTKLLYPAVAKKFGIADKQVERAIRNAIETVWTRGDREALENVFGELYDEEIRPTNSEVIEKLVERVHQLIEGNGSNGSIQVENIC